MNTSETINWLRDQAKRVPEEVHKRGMIEAAAILERLRNNLKTAVAQRNDYQEKYWAEKERSARLEAELKAEMHRHDRLQDFEVAEAAELARLKAENATMAAELKKAGGSRQAATREAPHILWCLEKPYLPWQLLQAEPVNG